LWFKNADEKATGDDNLITDTGTENGAIILKGKGIMSTLEERSAERRKRMVCNRASDFKEAEAWDLDFWQKAGPEARLSALVAIHEDVALVEAARASNPQDQD